MAEYQKQKLFVELATIIANSDNLAEATSQAATFMRRFPKKCGFLSASPARKGDFSLVLQRLSLSPEIVATINLPGKGRAPIVTVVYEEPE